MTTIFHAKPYGRLIEIQGHLGRKKLDRTNQGSNFVGDNFSNKDNVRAPIQFGRESQPQQLKDDFSSRTDPSVPYPEFVWAYWYMYWDQDFN